MNINNTSRRIFIDMDGTLARFHDEINYLERMWGKGFFEELKPFTNMILGTDLINNQASNVEVYILSAAIDSEYCKTEKHNWLDKYLPNIDKHHRIFTKIGEPKSNFIPGGISKSDYLIDDYNIGLDNWVEHGGSAIKCVNNINHKGLIGELWKGNIVKVESSPYEIQEQIASCIQKSNKLNKSKGR